MLRLQQPKDCAMTSPAHATAFDSTAIPAIAPGLITRFRSHVARLKVARAGQARRTALLPETLRDTGCSPDDLTGALSHDPALPFFMQAQFGHRAW
jgi:hypothetical protein